MAPLRLVLTSDLALRSDRPERFRLLDETLGSAREFDAHLIAVAGDLFGDSEPSASLLDAARDRFGAAEIPVVVIPGDRDSGLSRIAAVRADVLGPQVHILAGEPIEQVRVGGVDVVGLPFQDGPTAGECLANVRGEPASSLLLAHAALVGESSASGLAMPLLPADLRGRFALAVLGCGQPAPGRLHRLGSTTVALTSDSALMLELSSGPESTIPTAAEPARAAPSDLVIHLLPGRENQALGELARRLSATRTSGPHGSGLIHGGSILAPDAWSRSLEAVLRGAHAALGATTPESADDPRPPIEQQIDFCPELANSAILRDLVSCIDRLAVAAVSATESSPQGADDAQRERSAIVAEACRLGLRALAAELREQ